MSRYRSEMSTQERLSRPRAYKSHNNSGRANERSDTSRGSNNSTTSALSSTGNGSITVQVDYTNNHVHTGKLPVEFIENIQNPLEGYPKLQKLRQLKRKQVLDHATRPYGCRVAPDRIIPTLNRWINIHKLQFDVIMIGALADNQFIYPILSQLPLHRLCAKPGFLFIWATTHKIQELSKLLNSDSWGKKFRRSEELVFVPINKDSPYNQTTEFELNSKVPLFERQQWHCWMCITGTVRRSSDNHLIHCNVDTDLQIASPDATTNGCVPDNLYKVVENFSNSNRRLHIMPSYIGYNLPVRVRPGWVILSPDSTLDNFDPARYQEELIGKSLIKNRSNASSENPHYLVPQNEEIEELRPKSPIITPR